MDHRRYRTTQGTPESPRLPLAFEKTLLVQIARWLPLLGKSEYTMDEIRRMYSSMKIHKNQQQREKDKRLALT